MTNITYDESLPAAAKVLKNYLTAEQIFAGAVVRDVSGRLSFFAAAELPLQDFEELKASLESSLGAYARSDRVLAHGDDYGADVLSDQSAYKVEIEGTKLRVVDRRLVGMDWLRKPMPPNDSPPRFVFASLKGGVGRSTALSVVALHLANGGKRVLVVDLDMEAPGLSSILLSEDTMPRFGVIDALVENGISGLTDDFYRDLVAPSALAEKSGVIDVVPAFGKASMENPAEILGKLARAYAEDLSPDGPASILDQIRVTVERLADPHRYDAVLIDARAGLHETSASAILGLGADIFFFGLNEKQTFQGYSALFAHLARLETEAEAGWEDVITMVQARASGARQDQETFAERCAQLFQLLGRDQPSKNESAVSLPAEPFGNVPWDDALDDKIVDVDRGDLRAPIIVLDDERFKHYAPSVRSELMLPRLYQSTFGPLLDRIDETLAAVSGYGDTDPS